MKIYTKSGDQGETSLFGGRRLPKSDLRIEAYGTVDELNSFVGLFRDSVENENYRQILMEIQNRLFVIGSNLACDPDRDLPIPDILAADVEVLEHEMDQMHTELPPLKNFILPGGHRTVSLGHVCRTVTRRAERLVVALSQKDNIEPVVIQYLNRLSDYFFMLARKLGQDLKAEEIPWKPR